MKYILRYLFPVSTFILVFCIYRYLTYPYGVQTNEFNEVYQPGDAATFENYESQCKSEFDRKLTFPLGEVSKAVVCKGFFSFDKTLSDTTTRRLLEILNDTSSYIWGEVGTFLPERKIVFYDAENNPIGITEFEEENGTQTYSHPYLRRTKWGSLNQKVFSEINRLLSE